MMPTSVIGGAPPLSQSRSPNETGHLWAESVVLVSASDASHIVTCWIVQLLQDMFGGNRHPVPVEQDLVVIIHDPYREVPTVGFAATGASGGRIFEAFIPRSQRPIRMRRWRGQTDMYQRKHKQQSGGASGRPADRSLQGWPEPGPK